MARYRLLPLTAFLVALAAPSLAQQPASLDDLRQLLEKDPASGFEQAARIFEELKAKGDLDGMRAIIDVVAPQAQTLCVRPLEAMYASAIKAAEGAGGGRSWGTCTPSDSSGWTGYGARRAF
jgi:hypothetical protein